MRLIVSQRGSAFLLEALFAIVVVSVGMLALVALVGDAMRASGGGRWRGEAHDIAYATLSRMWAEDPATLDARYDGEDGPGYRALLAAAMRLPGVSERVNAPFVAIDEAAPDGRRVSVTVRWQPPGQPSAHRVELTATLPGP